MNIVKSGNDLILRRYGGTVNGKNVSTRIGRLGADIRPNDIPDALKENLTPLELKQLQEHLSAANLERMKKQAENLTAVINDMSCAVGAGLLDEESVATLQKACKALTDAAKQAHKSKPMGSNKSVG